MLKHNFANLVAFIKTQITTLKVQNTLKMKHFNQNDIRLYHNQTFAPNRNFFIHIYTPIKSYAGHRKRKLYKQYTEKEARQIILQHVAAQLHLATRSRPHHRQVLPWGGDPIDKTRSSKGSL